jgi:hypothetical protein
MVLMRRFVRVRCSTVELFPKTILLQAVVEKNLDGSEALSLSRRRAILI